MPKSQMLINYVPGEECRVAIVEDGKLEELHTERFANASRVGNIYVGRVSNVEAAIQAAFVDFGVGENGFLHVSDLHPRYFPGETDETTEQVGHKTPRRERPPVQQALKRGDEVIVQVLKEGVGTKGPTLTTYLSIPGRFLVMMPGMDKVGVSRKVEDEEQRRKMRDILDQLDLPEGFGFILRTAGMDRSKIELKRDLAYLQRLYKDMERRRESSPEADGAAPAKGRRTRRPRKRGEVKPRLLYSESDLLVRALRDQLTTEVEEIIIDNESALQRAARFLKIVAPRTQTRLLHYPGQAPVFHAFAVEEQISLIHAREVPLPSGGRLVIDQTEALVAIDVNSGKSRDSRDAEENAFRTNLEAVDEICRQLKLRDLGGIVVNDLIDMRSPQHRREVENRFKDRLKRDRAKSTLETISKFGILEMTRQRMRGSMESVHFADCPTCRGRGLVQKPDSVASDALRELQALLDVEKVGRVELVVSPRVAGELLSTKRQLLGRIERLSGKRVDVRVSEALPPDRVTFYAYDQLGSDIDLSLPLPRRKVKDLVEWSEPETPAEAEAPDTWAADPSAERAEAAALDAQTPPEEVVEIGAHPIEVSDEELDAEIEAQESHLAPGGPAPADRGAPPPHERDGGRRRRGGRGRGQCGPDLRSAPPGPAGRVPDQRRSDNFGAPPLGPDGTPLPRPERRPLPPAPAAAPRPAARDAAGIHSVVTPRGVILMGDHGDEDAPRTPSLPPPPPPGALPPYPTDPVPGADDFGPPGEGGYSDGQSGDGRRRRRRRRRGGRGRGGVGPNGQPAQPGDNNPPPPGGSEAFYHEGPDDEIDGPPSPAVPLVPVDAGPSRQGDSWPEDRDSAAPQGDPVTGEGDQRRRRRRRGRRGRGSGSGGGSNGGNGGHPLNGAPSGVNAPYPPPPAPRPPAPRPANVPPPRDQRPPAAPAPSAGAPSTPKLLYRSRRKLSVSELNRRPKPE